MSQKNIFCDISDIVNEASVERCFVNRLLECIGYNDADIKTKTAIKYFKIGKGSKSDNYKPDYVIVVDNIPVMIIDAKSPKEDIKDWTQQCSSYCLELNKSYTDNPVKYFVITNALNTIINQWDKEDSLLTLTFHDFIKDGKKFVKLNNIISKQSIISLLKIKQETDKSEFVFSKISVEDLFSKFQKVHSYIWKKEKKKPSSVFEELIKLIFIKIKKDKEIFDKYHGENNPNIEEVVFSTYWIDKQTESDNPINDLLFVNLVKELEKDLKNGHKKRIFDKDEQINLSTDTIYNVVKELQNIDLYSMEEDVHGRMFESFLDATARGKEIGQFFTTRDVVSLMVGLADLKVTKNKIDTVLDACCGSGGFLIKAMSNMLIKANSLSCSNIEKEEIKKSIKNKSLYGIDAGSDPKIYRIARMNMYLHGDGGSNIYFADSLNKKLGSIGKSSIEYDEEIKEAQNLFSSIKFDVILSNPPFSMKYESNDSDQSKILDQYKISMLGGKKAKSLLSSVMFLERYKEFISETGFIYTIVDESILSGESYVEVRNWIRKTFIIEGIISLPGDAFKRSDARVKTSILILRLKKDNEVQEHVFLYYSVRIGLEKKIAKKIGIPIDTLDFLKHKEMDIIINEFLLFRKGEVTKHTYPASFIKNRLDVKYCINDNGRKKNIWKEQGRKSVFFGSVLIQPQDRKVLLNKDKEYQFLRVTYKGDVTEGDNIIGSDCSYSRLFKVKTWDILISNMGVGRGAIGIVPPYLSEKFVSNEYTILTASSKEEAVYYSNLIKTKEILGDILSTTTGMNRGRIDWDVISKVNIPEYLQSDMDIIKIVEELESHWSAYEKYIKTKNKYLHIITEKLDLNSIDAQERWLGFKPPE